MPSQSFMMKQNLISTIYIRYIPKEDYVPTYLNYQIYLLTTCPSLVVHHDFMLFLLILQDYVLYKAFADTFTDISIAIAILGFC